MVTRSALSSLIRGKYRENSSSNLLARPVDSRSRIGIAGLEV